MLAKLLLATLIASSTPITDPYRIYKEAIQHLATLPQPSYIDDIEHWVTTSLIGSESRVDEFDERGLFRSSDRRENILSVPYSPHDSPIVGPSYFAPDAWLIHHWEASASTSFNPDLSDMRVIANVVSIGKPSYDISLQGIVALTNGGQAYHLVLRPLGDPVKHNLRELWINTQTVNIVEAVLVGNYSPSSRNILQLTTISEDFGAVGPYWVIIHRHWTYSVPFAGRKYDYDASVKSMAFPNFIPGWYFDERAFAAHRNEVNTTSHWDASGPNS